jgi:beta-glucosidase
MALSDDQVELIEHVTWVNPRTVVVVNASRAVHMPWADRAAAVLMTWFPGELLAPALASVLLGDREPAGRLPITIPRRDEDIPGWGVGLGKDKTLDYDAAEPTGYRHARRHGIAPRYPFGFGLSYTTFELVDARVASGAGTDQVTVTATVRNTGDRAGRELSGGESGMVTFTLDAQAFRRWDEPTGRWSAPRGTHQVLIGRSSVDVPVTVGIER